MVEVIVSGPVLDNLPYDINLSRYWKPLTFIILTWYTWKTRPIQKKIKGSYMLHPWSHVDSPLIPDVPVIPSYNKAILRTMKKPAS